MQIRLWTHKRCPHSSGVSYGMSSVGILEQVEINMMALLRCPTDALQKDIKVSYLIISSRSAICYHITSTRSAICYHITSTRSAICYHITSTRSAICYHITSTRSAICYHITSTRSAICYHITSTRSVSCYWIISTRSASCYHITVETPYSTIQYTTIFDITWWAHGPQNLQRPIRTLIVLLGFRIKQIFV